MRPRHSLSRQQDIAEGVQWRDPDRVQDWMGELSKSEPVVVYCASQQCNSSEKAAKKLEAAGFTAVSRYTDGAAAWQKEACEVPAGHCG